MNINFVVTVHSFEKASKIEAVLRTENINFSVQVTNKPNPPNGKRRARMVITKKEVMAVEQCFASNPGFNTNDVSHATGVSRATVGRIKLGTHALQRSGSDIEKDI